AVVGTSRLAYAVADPASSRTALNLNVNFFWALGAIFQQRRTQPALQPQLRRKVHVAAAFRAFPLQSKLMSRERRCCKDHCETLLSMRNLRDRAINHLVCSRNKGLLNQSHTGIVEDPHAEMLVRSDDVDCVHTRESRACRFRSLRRGIGNHDARHGSQAESAMGFPVLFEIVPSVFQPGLVLLQKT